MTDENDHGPFPSIALRTPTPCDTCGDRVKPEYVVTGGDVTKRYCSRACFVEGQGIDV